jgi:HEAT repeats/PBS lyase HEAT-like repeat
MDKLGLATLVTVLALAGTARAGEGPKGEGKSNAEGHREESYKGKSLNEWVQTLGHGDPDVRGEACHALAAFGPRARPALAALIGALEDPDRWVRWSAAHAIGEIGPVAVSAVPALIKALQDQDKAVRYQAASSLGQFGPGAKLAVPALIRVLDDKESDVRAYAARALGDIGREPGVVVPALASALKQEKTPCRRFGSMALFAHRDPRSVDSWTHTRFQPFAPPNTVCSRIAAIASSASLTARPADRGGSSSSGCAILNSATVTELVRPFMSYGKDERHFDKHIWQRPSGNSNSNPGDTSPLSGETSGNSSPRARPVGTWSRWSRNC